MIHHPFATDAQHKSQDLADAITVASSPFKVCDACAAIDSFLRHHSPEQSRWFFSITFPTLICKLFGFDDSSSSCSTATSSPPKPSFSNGWIDLIAASNDSALAGRVFDLLSPNGILMSSIASVDRLSLVKYVFPMERLPEWVRALISSDRDCLLLPDLCPLFKGRVKEDMVRGSSFQVQLNVFEYYMFWFAYYPLCRGNSDSSETPCSAPKSIKFKLENWASTLPVFAGRRELQQKIECNLYVRLFYAYLRAYVPNYDLNTHQPYRSSLLHYPSGYDGSVASHADFLVNTLIQFWLAYNDFSPLSVDVCKSFGVSVQSRMFGEAPPPPGLGDLVKLFVKYINVSLASVTETSDVVACSGSPRWKIAGSADVSKLRDATLISPPVCSWNLWIQRPLYRFILRTFLFYPVGTSMRNASEVFSIWISYMEPWTVGSDEFSELDATVDRSAYITRKDDSNPSPRGYSAIWQRYVLSNYLFYSSLVMHFIGFAHKFLHTGPEVIVQMVLKVIEILTSTSEFAELMKNMDITIHSKQAEPGKSTVNSLHRYVPIIREQLQDWEHGLCESDADGSFLHENWNKDLQLFANGEYGGQHLLQLFILRAETELQAVSGDNMMRNLQRIDALKTQVGCLYGGRVMNSVRSTSEAMQHRQSREEIFNPRVGNRTVDDIQYRGDWMKRPISDDEIAWLAKLLIWLSDWLNVNLGLDRVESGETSSVWLDVSDVDVKEICGPADTIKMILCSVGSWLVMLGLAVLRLMRRYGVKVNLRILASKKIVLVVLIGVAAFFVKSAFRQRV